MATAGQVYTFLFVIFSRTIAEDHKFRFWPGQVGCGSRGLSQLELKVVRGFPLSVDAL